MEIVTKIAPLALAFIMLGLGLGLSIKDFTRVIKTPKDFLNWNCLPTNSFTNSCIYHNYHITITY